MDKKALLLEPVVVGYARLADTRIYYEVFGEGPPVFLLHGNGEELHVFDEIIPALAARMRVIALDTRGHGRSGRGEKPLDFTTLSQDVLDVMDLLKIPKAALIGYSDGGNTALHVALARPERVTALALLGANLHAKGMLPRYQIPIQAGHLLCRALARFSPKAADSRDQLGLMVNHPKLSPADLRSLSIPALVVAGERDMIRRDHTQAIADALSQAQLHILGGVDHFGLVSAPGTLELLLRFLEGIEA